MVSSRSEQNKNSVPIQPLPSVRPSVPSFKYFEDFHTFFKGIFWKLIIETILQKKKLNLGPYCGISPILRYRPIFDILMVSSPNFFNGTYEILHFKYPMGVQLSHKILLIQVHIYLGEGYQKFGPAELNTFLLVEFAYIA